MRRPNEDHQFWQQRIQWEKIASKRSSIAASRVAAAIDTIKRKKGEDKGIPNGTLRRSNNIQTITRNTRLSSLPPSIARVTTTTTTTPRRGIGSNTVYNDHTSTASSSSSSSTYNYPSLSSASSLGSSSYLTGSLDLCSSCYDDNNSCDDTAAGYCRSTASSSRGTTSYTGTLTTTSSSSINSSRSRRGGVPKSLGSPPSCSLSMTSADVERLVQDEIKRAIVPLQTALKEEKECREKAEKAIELLRRQGSSSVGQ